MCWKQENIGIREFAFLAVTRLSPLNLMNDQ